MMIVTIQQQNHRCKVSLAAPSTNGRNRGCRMVDLTRSTDRFELAATVRAASIYVRFGRMSSEASQSAIGYISSSLGLGSLLNFYPIPSILIEPWRALGGYSAGIASIFVVLSLQ
jgi:hypothetical protein